MAKYVLIIEDDALLQKAYKLKFAKQGIEIRAATDGGEALALLKQNDLPPPAVIILDLMLPHTSGFEVLQAVKATKGWAEVPVLVLSNLSQSTDLEKAKSLGVAEYLVKADIKIDDVVQKVMQYLKP